MQKPIYETALFGALLSFSGGLMDAYAYLFVDPIFSNAQTGNNLLFSVRLFERNFSEALRYFLPVAFFAIGIALSNTQRQSARLRDWRTLCLLEEILLMSMVAFFPVKWNYITDTVLSLACGIQVEAFRKIEDNAVATTMCIGNFRSGIHALTEKNFRSDAAVRNTARTTFGLIGSFILGAVTGGVGLKYLHAYTILISPVVLLLCLWLLRHNAVTDGGESGA